MTKYRRILIAHMILVPAWIICAVLWPLAGCFVGFLAGYNTYRLEQWRRAMEISR